MREGLLAELADEAALARAVRHLYAIGYRDIDAFTPFPSEVVSHAMELPRSRLPFIVLLGAIAGGSLGYLIMFFTNVIDYPLDVGGRDPNPWPAFIPVTFESAVLLGGISAFIGFFALVRLPKLWHPLFEVPAFRRVTRDGFFLAVSSRDRCFDLERTAAELRECDALAIDRFGFGEEERA